MRKNLFWFQFLLLALMLLWFNNICSASYEYMIIVHESLNGPALQQFINHKQNMDFNVDKRVISDGTSNHVIRNFIQQAFYQGSSMPQFVLLVGTAAFDTLSGDSLANAEKGNFIPAFYVIDEFGVRTAVDQWFVEVDSLRRSGRIPDIHVGRLPVTNQAELQAFVNKLIHYENDASCHSWKWNILFLAGDVYRGPFPDYPSPYMVNLVTDEVMTDYIPDYMVKNVLHATDFSTAQERKDTTIHLIDDGQLIINALGTGADRGNLVYFLDRFGSGADFDANTDLSNPQKYPFVIGASARLAQFDTCLADTLGNPISTVSQNLLFCENAGAIALFGGSGATSQFDNFDLVRDLFTSIFEKDITNLGQLTTATKLLRRSSGLAPANYREYALLGDPSMNLGIIPTYLKPFSRSGFEPSDPICHQNEVVSSAYVSNTTGRLESSGWLNIVGYLRDYRVEGDDNSNDLDSYCYWKLYDVDVSIDSIHRFLSFYLTVYESPEDLGHVCLDARTSDGLYLRNDSSIVDQYGERIHPAFHHSTKNWWEFYAFDLKGYFGKSIDQLLFGYDDSLHSESGHFRATVDEIRFSPDWGSAPYVAEISMPFPIYVGNSYAVSVETSEDDSIIFGDQLTLDWWLEPSDSAFGTISGSGPNIIYHAPNSSRRDIVINIKVSDKGGHVVTRSKVFSVKEIEDGGCPFVYIWNGEVFANDNVILTASENQHIDWSKIIDYCVLSQAPVPKNNHYELEISEFENEVSFIDRFHLIVVDYPERENIGITSDGEIWSYYKYLSPISCVDQSGEDHLEEIIKKDRKSFISHNPGYLIVNFGELSRVNFHKSFISSGCGGGGTPIPSGNKKYVKLATPSQIRGNIAHIDVLQKDGKWKTVAEVYPRTGKVHTLVDLAQYADPDEDFLIKISWEKSYSVNHIAYYCFEDNQITINRLPLSSAVHSRQGEIKALLSDADDQIAVLSPDETIKLFFPALPENPSSKRGFILVTKGYYKSLEEIPSGDLLPGVLTMEQNYPNPFNRTTHIKFSLPEATKVALNIYNILGRKVATLIDEEKSRGTYSVSWNGKDRSGTEVASGIYLYQINTRDFSATKKMILIR